MRELLSPRRIAALLLGGVVAFASVASSSTLYRCTMQTGLMKACCCPSQQADAPPPPAFERASCCQDVDFEVVTSPSETPRRDDNVAPPPALSAALVPFTPPAVTGAPVLGLPPPRGPPLLILKQALLI
jgi:hypothetical protein